MSRYAGCTTPLKPVAVVAGVTPASRRRYFLLGAAIMRRMGTSPGWTDGAPYRTGDEKRKQDVAGDVRLVPDVHFVALSDHDALLRSIWLRDLVACTTAQAMRVFASRTARIEAVARAARAPRLDRETLPQELLRHSRKHAAGPCRR